MYNVPCSSLPIVLLLLRLYIWPLHGVIPLLAAVVLLDLAVPDGGRRVA